MIAKKLSDLRNLQTFMVLTPVSIYIPAIEPTFRDPTNDITRPSRTEEVWKLEVFYNKSEWTKRVMELTTKGEKFKAYKAEPAKINISINGESDE